MSSIRVLRFKTAFRGVVLRFISAYGLERLGITPAQQAQIDGQFLDSALEMLSHKSDYKGMGEVTRVGSVGTQLEAVYVRTLDAAHEAIIADRDLNPVTVANLGKLSFLESLELPSANKVPKNTPKNDDKRAWWDYYDNQRLFVGLPNSDT